MVEVAFVVTAEEKDETVKVTAQLVQLGCWIANERRYETRS
jgi:hypothetical protein